MSARICIKCGETLQPLEVVGVEIDCCGGCGGIWLDEGEVKALAAQPAETAAKVSMFEQDAGGQFTPTDPGVSAEALAKPCPACGGKLTHALFGPTAIEHCNGCHGIFVDRGELDKAMRLVDTTEATTIVALAKSVQTSGVLGE